MEGTSLRGARRGQRHPLLFPFVAAPLLTALALAESWLDPTFRAELAPLAVGSVWIGVAFLVGARFPAAAPFLVALFYPLTAALGGPGPGGAGLIATLLAAGWAGYATSARASLTGTVATVLVFLVTDAAVHGGISWDTIFFPAVFFPGRWAGALVRREQQPPPSWSS